MRSIVITIKIVITATFVFAIISCGGMKTPENLNAEQVFNDGVKLFENGDYLEAKQYFDIIKLQYPASQYADNAQYYLAEINYKRSEYILAAFNYSMLRRVYPGSPYSKESLYKNALCYFQLSPSYDRDQEYTTKAIESFMEFQYLYPDDSLNIESGKRIAELRDKLAYREFFTAELYRKMESPRASVIYYDAVINNFSDSKYYEDSYIGKIEALYFMKRYDQAVSIIRAYSTQFPNGKATSRNNQIVKEINDLKSK
ncbi:MAG: outer membrane protein assembly factor BamD [Candidatus Kapabacteria bacterium]|nr:outer membrane protein assembly factor BamD [Ignavibacteriota bacterium]MCW5884213.1 outer membrane protein assembly factor BamD [Candidatus Kapabacteria bacterium]